MSDFTRSRELLVAFIATLLIGLGGVAGVLLYGRRRPVGAPLSWGQAMVGAMIAMFLFLWWYAVIPHQWLTWSGNELGWRSDKVLLEPTGNQPITYTYKHLAETVAVLIYGVGLALHIAVWALWNDRAKQRPVEVPASRYGRPLVRKG